MLATLTSKGQVTLPKEIRDALALESGAKLDFSLQPDGSVNVRPLKNSVASLFGILKRPGRKAFSIDTNVLLRLLPDDARPYAAPFRTRQNSLMPTSNSIERP
jgi:antitoxin PrlF